MYFDVLNQTNAQPGVLAFPQAMLQEDLEAAFLRFGQEMVGPGVRFRIVLEGQPRPLHPLIQEESYRIGREALLNAFRHSGATRVELYLKYTPTGLHIGVHDNGKGISADLLHLGCDGLRFMHEVAERIGAKLKLLSRVKAGTEILLFIPREISFASQTVSRVCA